MELKTHWLEFLPEINPGSVRVGRIVHETEHIEAEIYRLQKRLSYLQRQAFELAVEQYNQNEISNAIENWRREENHARR
ncbi:MAG: hypothetical protein ACE5IR_08395 [bacterium]